MTKSVELWGKQIKVEGRLLRTARLDADKYDTLEQPERTIRALRACGIRIDLFTFLQGLPETSPRYPYSFEWDNLAVLRVSTFENWWSTQVDAKTRNMVRKAEKKGVTVRNVAFDDDLVRGICKIYNECPIRQGKPFPHYGKDPESIHKEEATYLDRSIFIGALVRGELIGFIKLVVSEDRMQAGVLNLVSLLRDRDKAPNNALLAEAVRRCTVLGIPHLVYSNFAYGRKQRDSLSDFKQNNGFQRVDLPRYYIPLSRLGAAAFRLGLHKRLADHVPGTVISRLRELRNAWYNRKFRSLPEPS